MYKIGIGISVHNRNEQAYECISNIKKYSKYHKLVIIDDASDIPIKDKKCYRFDEQQGIAKVKNKCIELLEDCDYIFLFDDDCWPMKKGWEDLYINAFIKTGNHHLCFIWNTMLDRTPAYCQLIDPLDSGVRYVDQYTHGCGCMMFLTKYCIEQIGGFNIKYGIYGNEHIAYAHRAHNANLTPFGTFLDAVGSEGYIYAKDRELDHESSLSKQYREDLYHGSLDELGREKLTKEFMQFKNYI